MFARAYRFSMRNVRAYKWLVAGVWLLLVAGVGLGWWQAGRNWPVAFFLSLVSILLATAWARWQRERLIREQPLPQFLKRKLRQAYPNLSHKDADLVERGLRQFFLACNRSPGKFVAMPSRVVDAMWHEFILHTQAYRDWCQLALGRFLHHTPSEALGAKATHNDGLRRAWYWCCKEEAINPRQPTRLPLLFALDGKLAIPGGFRYEPDCRKLDGAAGSGASFAYCATSFGDDSASGSSDDFGGAESAAGSGDGTSGSDGGSDGGGDGGGCGGGGGD